MSQTQPQNQKDSDGVNMQYATETNRENIWTSGSHIRLSLHKGDAYQKHSS